MDGGGCGCGCGGSILVDFTDIGKTYSKSDDYDNDGIEDDFDNCAFAVNASQVDGDGDGVGDACDNAPNDSNHDQADVDQDGIGDVIDTDIDGDGIDNAVKGGAAPSPADNCDHVKNVSQADVDGDKIGDSCDPDIDGDGVLNAQDPCPLRADNNAANGSCVPDADQDGVSDITDNCVGAYNPTQGDNDKDGIGDSCDTDLDGDGIANLADNCVKNINKDQKDADRDGAGDTCDGKFCYIAAKNPNADCLDPQSAFAVTAGPAVQAKTGEAMLLALYANRPTVVTDAGVSIRYTYTITARPNGSTATINNPRGTVQTQADYEYHFDDAKRPTFTPDVAGEYKFSVSAELVNDDTLFSGAVTAQSQATVEVAGPNKAHGCSAAGGVELAWLFSALAMAARRIRRK